MQKLFIVTVCKAQDNIVKVYNIVYIVNIILFFSETSGQKVTNPTVGLN